MANINDAAEFDEVGVVSVNPAIDLRSASSDEDDTNSRHIAAVSSGTSARAGNKGHHHHHRHKNGGGVKLNATPEAQLEFSIKRRIMSGLVRFVSGFGIILQFMGIRGAEYRLLRAFSRVSGIVQSRVKGVDFSTSTIGGVPVRIYRPSSGDSTKPRSNNKTNQQPVAGKYSISSKRISTVNGDAGCIIYCHGGSFVLSSARAYHTKTANLCLNTGAVVVSVDYRLAPEHPFPAGLDDCITVTRAILDDAPLPDLDPYIDKDRVLIAGDCAGGNFAVNVALDLIRFPPRRRRLHGVFALCPLLQAITMRHLPSCQLYNDTNCSRLSYRANWCLPIYAGLVPTKELQHAISEDAHVSGTLWHRLIAKIVPGFQQNNDNSPAPNFEPNVPKALSNLAVDPKAWPLLAEEFELKQMPHMMIMSCDHDSLSSEMETFASRLRLLCGTHRIRFSQLKRAQHCEPMLFSMITSEASRTGYQEIVNYLKESLARPAEVESVIIPTVAHVLGGVEEETVGGDNDDGVVSNEIEITINENQSEGDVVLRVMA